MRKWLVLLTGVILAFGAEADGPAKKQQGSQRTRSEVAGQSKMTGCVDQRGETYVLTSLDSMRTETLLRGRTFSDDNFARFVGTKATVQGELLTENNQKVLHVTRIDKTGETCR